MTYYNSQFSSYYLSSMFSFLTVVGQRIVFSDTKVLTEFLNVKPFTSYAPHLHYILVSNALTHSERF